MGSSQNGADFKTFEPSRLEFGSFLSQSSQLFRAVPAHKHLPLVEREHYRSESSRFEFGTLQVDQSILYDAIHEPSRVGIITVYRYHWYTVALIRAE